MEFNARNPYVNLRLRMSHDGEFKMPPVGFTCTRYTIAGVKYERWGVRCEVEGCWFAGGTLPTKEEAEKYLEDHRAGRNFVAACPAPPRRESLPSGLRHVEKLWRELDDVVEALAVGEAYRSMTKEQIQGYAKGIAFSIVMLEPIYFESIEEVSRHARDRRRMRLGEIDWQATPTTLNPDVLTVQARGLHRSADQASAKRSTAKPVPDQIQKAIKAGVSSGLFGVEELAETYNLPVATVRQIIG